MGLDPFPIVLCSVCSTLAQTGADLSSMDVTHHFMCNSTGTQSAQISSNILSICEVFPDEINELLAREAPEASKTKKEIISIAASHPHHQVAKPHGKGTMLWF